MHGLFLHLLFYCMYHLLPPGGFSSDWKREEAAPPHKENAILHCISNLSHYVFLTSTHRTPPSPPPPSCLPRRTRCLRRALPQRVSTAWLHNATPFCRRPNARTRVLANGTRLRSRRCGLWPPTATLPSWPRRWLLRGLPYTGPTGCSGSCWKIMPNILWMVNSVYMVYDSFVC